MIAMNHSSLSGLRPAASPNVDSGGQLQTGQIQPDLLHLGKLNDLIAQFTVQDESAITATAQTMSRLASKSPDALSLYLATRASQLNQQLTMLNASGASVIAPYAADPTATLMTSDTPGIEQAQRNFLMEYSRFADAINDLMKNIGDAPVARSDGKVTMNHEAILKLVESFVSEWTANGRDNLITFSSEEDARRFVEDYGGKLDKLADKALRVEGKSVYLDFQVLNPIMDAVAKDPGSATYLKEWLTDEWVRHIGNSRWKLLQRMNPDTGSIGNVDALRRAAGQVKKAVQVDFVMERGMSAVKRFEEVLVGASEKTVAKRNELLMKFAKFVKAVNDLMLQLNGIPTAKSNGKLDMKHDAMLKLIGDFGATWKKNGADKLMTFASEEEAKRFVSRSAGNSLRVVGSSVYIDFHVLDPVMTAIANDATSAAYLKSWLDPSWVGEINNSRWKLYYETRPEEGSASDLQSVQLGTSDVQKAAQTDMDLQITESSRAISQFDNLMKLYSSLMAAITDTCKSFL